MSTALKQCKHILIVGVHQFEGFHICSKLVEEGLLVDGVVIVPKNPLQKNMRRRNDVARAERTFSFIGRRQLDRGCFQKAI